MPRKIGSVIYKVEEVVRKTFYKAFRESVIKCSLGSCGKNVHIAEKCDIKGNKNINIGNDVAIGPHALLWTTGAKLTIKDKVIIGPRLSIITGDHKIDIIGKYMADITADEKDEKDEGANVTILKGVTIAEGCVIGGGAVVTKSTEPYGIYVGVPARHIRERFTDEEIQEHKKGLI